MVTFNAPAVLFCLSCPRRRLRVILQTLLRTSRLEATDQTLTGTNVLM